MSVPTRSAGSRSGVNWMRWKWASSVSEKVFTASVLASPGTPSSRMWPWQRTPTMSLSRSPFWPTITFCISATTLSTKRLSCRTISLIAWMSVGMPSPWLQDALLNGTGTVIMFAPRFRTGAESRTPTPITSNSYPSKRGGPPAQKARHRIRGRGPRGRIVELPRGGDVPRLGPLHRAGAGGGGRADRHSGGAVAVTLLHAAPQGPGRGHLAYEQGGSDAHGADRHRGRDRGAGLVLQRDGGQPLQRRHGGESF